MGTEQSLSSLPKTASSPSAEHRLHHHSRRHIDTGQHHVNISPDTLYNVTCLASGYNESCLLSSVYQMQATLEWENQDDGFLAKILVGDNSKDIPVGTPVAVITDEKEDVSSVSCSLSALHIHLLLNACSS